MTTTIPESVDAWIKELADDPQWSDGLKTAIRAAVEEDDEPEHKATRQLLRLYLTSTPAQRGLIDHVLVMVCGWCFDSLLDRSEMPRDALEDFRTAVIDSGGADF